MRTCDVDGCDRKHHGRGWCMTHYERLRRHGDVRPNDPIQHVRICGVDGCDRKHYGHGFCKPHCDRWTLHGDPLAGRPIRSLPLGQYNVRGAKPKFDPVDTDEL